MPPPPTLLWAAHQILLPSRRGRLNPFPRSLARHSHQMKFLDNVKLERIARAGGGMGETKQPLPLHRCDCGQTMRRERSNPAEFGEISRVARSGRSIAVTSARCIWGLYIGTMDGWRLWEQIFEGPKSAGRRGEDAREERSAEHPTNEATTFSHFGHFKSGAARRRAEGGREGRSRNFTQRSKRTASSSASSAEAVK